MAYVTLIPIVEGSLARASEVMGNFQGLADAINGNLDGSNIQDGSITAQKIVDGAVTSGKLAANSVVGSNIVNGTITGNKFAPGAIGQASITDGSITEAKLADNSVSRFKLQDSAVSAEKIANSAVTSSKIADGEVGTTKIEDDSITAEKIRDSAVSLRHMNFMHGIREIAYLYVGSDGTILQGGGLPSGASFSRVSTGTYRITGLGTMTQANSFLAIGSTFSPSNRFIGAGAVLQGTLTVTTVDSSGNLVDAEFGMILIRGI